MNFPRHLLLRLTALACGAFSATAIAQDPSKTSLELPKIDTAVTPVSATITTDVTVVNGKDALPVAMKEAKAALAKLRDYSAYMVREEQMNGKASPAQTHELRVRSEPFAIYTRGIAPQAVLGEELAYITDRKDDKVRVKQAGVAGAAGFLSVDMDDAKAMANSKHTLKNTGIAAVYDRVAHVLEAEKVARTKYEVLFAEYKFDGQVCDRYTILCERPHKARYAHKVVVYFSKDTKLPIRLEAYADPEPGEAEGTLLEMVSFVKLSLNQGLSESVFDK